MVDFEVPAAKKTSTGKPDQDYGVSTATRDQVLIMTLELE
jgi:hypothetical protein